MIDPCGNKSKFVLNLPDASTLIKANEGCHLIFRLRHQDLNNQDFLNIFYVSSTIPGPMVQG